MVFSETTEAAIIVRHCRGRGRGRRSAAQLAPARARPKAQQIPGARTALGQNCAPHRRERCVVEQLGVSHTELAPQRREVGH